jgi:hypothetical protein
MVGLAATKCQCQSGPSVKKEKTLYALAALILFGSGLMLFILAANEQSVLSRGSPAPTWTPLQNLIAQGPAANKHVELVDFYFGKNYIYTAKFVQFQDVYVPVFPEGAPENGANLHVLIWIRNDRNSNQRLIQSDQDLDRFVREFNQHPRPLSGVLQKPTERVRTLTAEAYPGTNPQSLDVLWARDFPTQQSATCSGRFARSASWEQGFSAWHIGGSPSLPPHMSPCEYREGTNTCSGLLSF